VFIINVLARITGNDTQTAKAKGYVKSSLIKSMKKQGIGP